jgi:hypothetical protein
MRYMNPFESVPLPLSGFVTTRGNSWVSLLVALCCSWRRRGYAHVDHRGAAVARSRRHMPAPRFWPSPILLMTSRCHSFHPVGDLLQTDIVSTYVAAPRDGRTFVCPLGEAFHVPDTNDLVRLTDREFSALSDRAKYYRAVAALLRTRVHSMKSSEARDEVLSLASSYESLAKQLESSVTPERGQT